MCCFFTVLVFLGPRAGILIWYLVNPTIWARAFRSRGSYRWRAPSLCPGRP